MSGIEQDGKIEGDNLVAGYNYLNMINRRMLAMFLPFEGRFPRLFCARDGTRFTVVTKEVERA